VAFFIIAAIAQGFQKQNIIIHPQLQILLIRKHSDSKQLEMDIPDIHYLHG